MTKHWKKLKSLSLFFPFFNDAGTVKKQIDAAYYYGSQVSSDLEVIAIHGGASRDNTLNEIYRQQRRYHDLILIDKTDNQEGYAVIKHGFRQASKEWIFYTDGDAQYHLNDLEKLVIKQQETGADVVNGYKRARRDSGWRRILGEGYRIAAQVCFRLPIRDVDCDFRLIKRRWLKKINLEGRNSSILVELIKKLEAVGASFAEVPVNHYPRIYNKSNYTVFHLLSEKLIGDTQVFFNLLKRGDKSQRHK